MIKVDVSPDVQSVELSPPAAREPQRTNAVDRGGWKDGE